MTNIIQLYSLATPNGQKVSIALEEMELQYEPHTIDIRKDEQFTSEFISINPNSKIPVIVDPDGPYGVPINIMESGAILLYLSEKSGMFVPKDPVLKYHTIQWLFFQMGGVGPMFGQFGHFYKYAGDKCKHDYPLNRYATETRRLLKVIDNQLQNKDWVVGKEYTIADMAIFPWVDCLDKFYGAYDFLMLDEFENVRRWLLSCLDRPAVRVGMKVCDFPDN